MTQYKRIAIDTSKAVFRYTVSISKTGRCCGPISAARN
jgi:hypothetical protein